MLDQANVILPDGRPMPPLPEAMKGLDRDQRGYPIPFFVARNADGTPNFRRLDSNNNALCFKHGLCSISGTPLKRDDVWLVNGPEGAYSPVGGYRRPPARKDCLVWVLQVCPFLLAQPDSDGTSRIGLESSEGAASGNVFTTDKKIPDYFVLARTDGIHLFVDPPDWYVLVPNRPWLEVEHWQAGKLIEVRQRAQTIQEMNAWRKAHTGVVPAPMREFNRGFGAKRFPWDPR